MDEHLGDALVEKQAEVKATPADVETGWPADGSRPVHDA
jgi:hypothetical protein